MKKITLVSIITLLLLLAGCSGNGVGGYFGYPGFIVDPILYANTEIDGQAIDLNIRDIYAVVYTNDQGAPLDNSLWIYFVPKSINLHEIVTADFKPYVALKINDVSQITIDTNYFITNNLASSNFMTWMNANDGKPVLTGDTIDLDIWQISQTAGVNIEGKFTSTLSRNVHTGLAEEFRFDAPINHVKTSPPTLTD
ncbi:hypothetical protein KKB99_00950 [bacterium]|nr:hypothetical protein [bacterium]MBU1024553.1 hypothetical protein [bacterium]